MLDYVKYTFWAYVSVINVITFIAMCNDKVRAVKQKWRTRQCVLLMLDVFEGGIGGLICQQCFCHKASKPHFYIVFISGTLVAVGIIVMYKYVQFILRSIVMFNCNLFMKANQWKETMKIIGYVILCSLSYCWTRACPSFFIYPVLAESGQYFTYK